MKKFRNKISLAKNSRGCWILDTVKGCAICQDKKPLGCYDNCYAIGIANRYGMDFSNPVKRDFGKDTSQFFLFDIEDEMHLNQIVRGIEKIDMPFVRIGEMGDPSGDWEHTISVCGLIAQAKKPIVIITKHWEVIPDFMLGKINGIDLCINTSVSALDSNDEIQHRIEQYERLKQYCKSVLRVVTCDFNTDNKEGFEREVMQQYLLSFDSVIETVFRPSKDNRLVIEGVINTKKVQFLGSRMLASMRNEETFLGYCNECPDMCGVNV